MKKLIGGGLVLFMLLACGAWAVVTRSSVITAGDASFMGNVTVYENASFGTLGAGNTFTLISSMDSSIIPHDNNTYDLGGSANRWKNGWFNGTMAVGTSSATSKLTVAGTMEMTSGSGGGIKFADGTSQFTAGVAKTGDTMTGKLTLPSMSLTGVATIATIASSPTIETPFISSFTNATHNHSNAAGGGNIPESSVTGLSSDLTNRLLLAGGVMTGILTLDAITVPTAKAFAFNMADGTAPFTVVSTTVVTSLNADLLDGQSGAYYATAASYVPYTGATGTVTLGEQNLTTSGTITATYLSGDGSHITGIQHGTILYYLRSYSSEVSGYNVLSPTYDTASAEATIAITNILTNDTIKDLLTPSGYPGLTLLPDEPWQTHFHAQRTTGNKDVLIKATLIKRSGTIEVALNTSEATTAITNTKQAYEVHGFIPSGTTIEATDRLALRLFASSVGAGSATNISIFVEGSNLSHLEIPGPVVSIANFVPYTGATSATNLGVHNLTTTGTITATTFSGSGLSLTGVGLKASANTWTATNVFSSLLTATTTFCTTPSGVQTLANDGTIECNATYLRVVASTNEGATLDNNPAISNGVADGHRMLIQGTSNTNEVTIADSCNCQLTDRQSVTLGENDILDLIWNSSVSDWLEVTRSIKGR